MLLLVLTIAAASCAGSRKQKSQPPQAPPPPPPSEIFTVVEQMPQYPGGEEALLKFIMENIKYPPEAKEKNIQGRVIVKFVVNYNGSVENVEAVRGIDPVLDAEAVRVISMLKGFTPGMQKGKPVNVWYMIPVTFALKGQTEVPRPDILIKGTDTFYLRPAVSPSFPGGKEELLKYIKSDYRIPEETDKAGFHGSVIIYFLVSKDGNLSDFKVISGLSPSADAEALRVARQMPPWIPGKINEKAVNSAISIPFYTPTWPIVPQTGSGISEVFVVVEEMPVFPGGEKALMDFIYSNIKYPEKAREQGIQGRVILRFCVRSDGGIDLVSVLRGVSPELDGEAVRVIKSLPAWQPGKQSGKPVNVWYSIPVEFKLTGEGEKAAGQPSQPVPPAPVQTPQVPERIIFESGYDTPPYFPGGEKALSDYIESEKKFPEKAKLNNIKGIVMVRFTIDETGKIVSPSVLSGVNPDLDNEALRLVKSMTGWQPAKRKDIPVNASYALKIPFN